MASLNKGHYTEIPKKGLQVIINMYYELSVDKHYKEDALMWRDLQLIGEYIDAYVKRKMAEKRKE